MKIGACGCGTIASWISDFITQLNDPHIVKYAAASHNLEKCRAFADKYGWEKAYGSYEELMADPEVDLLYICVPNQLTTSCVSRPLSTEKTWSVKSLSP